MQPGSPRGIDDSVAEPGGDALRTQVAECVQRFQKTPLLPRPNAVALRRYEYFNAQRTAELFLNALPLADAALPDCGTSAYSPSFVAPVPFPGAKNERPVQGMVSQSTGLAHGLIRYEYKTNIIEEFRWDGGEHGLRVTCTQMGDVWLRLNRRGKRLAQIVLNADLSVAATPAPVDEGGLAGLKSLVPSIVECLRKPVEEKEPRGNRAGAALETRAR